MKKTIFLFLAFSAIASLAGFCLELVAFFSRPPYARSPQEIRIGERVRYLEEARLAAAARAGRTGPQIPLFAPHPAFCYTYNPGLTGVNGAGFHTSYEFAYCGSRPCVLPDEPQKFVVGIFGDSFADSAAADPGLLEKEIERLLPARKAVVIDFGVPGYEPEQYENVFLSYREMLDAAVFIDGVNGSWTADSRLIDSLPAFTARNSSGGSVRYADWPAAIPVFLTRLSLVPFLSSSMAVHLLWQWYINEDRLSAVLARITGAFLLSGSRAVKPAAPGWHLNPSAKPGKEGRLSEAWEKRTHTDWFYAHLLLHLQAREAGIADVHILQPSPFVPNSKAWTAEERQNVNRSFRLEEHVGGPYSLYQNEVRELREAGLSAEDFTPLFQRISGTVWKDGLHLNETGNRILAEKIAEAVTRRTGGASLPEEARTAGGEAA